MARQRSDPLLSCLRDVSLGFLTMTSYLEERGLKVRIVNLAQRMMKDRRFDVPAFLATLKPKAVGIDLHWLPHAHGSIEVAKLVKQIHPNVPVIFGGLSALFSRGTHPIPCRGLHPTR